MATVVTVQLTAKITLSDGYAGYSDSDLETEISMGMDGMEVRDIGPRNLIGELMTEDVAVVSREESE